MARTDDQHRENVAPLDTLGDGERHHGYWEFELKRGGQAVNQVNVEACGSGVIFEAAWEPDMVGTCAPNG